MAFDFKKSAESDNKFFDAPFGAESVQQSKQRSNGFSFDGDSLPSTRLMPKTTKKPSSGFSFGEQTSEKIGQKSSSQNASPFPRPLDIPAITSHGKSRVSPANRVDISWKLILCIITAIVVLILIIVYWDMILNFVYNVLAIMFLLVVLLIALRLLLTPRRRR